MNVRIRDLRSVVNRLLDTLEVAGVTELEITDDYYWDIPADIRFKIYDDVGEISPKLTMGQLSSDLDEIQKMLVADGSEVLVTYGLVWVAALLRYVGENAPPRGLQKLAVGGQCQTMFL